MDDSSILGFVIGRLILGCAVTVLVAMLVFVLVNGVERARLRFAPPGTPVPVSELSWDGPVPEGGHMVEASTSLEALRRTVLNGQQCDERVACWGAVRVPPGSLLVATVPDQCGNREWYGWTIGSTLTIEEVTWACQPVRAPLEEVAQPTYALLGVPLNRLPKGRLFVNVVGSGVPEVAVDGP